MCLCAKLKVSSTFWSFYDVCGVRSLFFICSCLHSVLLTVFNVIGGQKLVKVFECLDGKHFLKENNQRILNTRLFLRHESTQPVWKSTRWSFPSAKQRHEDESLPVIWAANSQQSAPNYGLFSTISVWTADWLESARSSWKPPLRTGPCLRSAVHTAPITSSSEPGSSFWADVHTAPIASSSEPGSSLRADVHTAPITSFSEPGSSFRAATGWDEQLRLWW